MASVLVPMLSHNMQDVVVDLACESDKHQVSQHPMRVDGK